MRIAATLKLAAFLFAVGLGAPALGQPTAAPASVPAPRVGELVTKYADKFGVPVGLVEALIATVSQNQSGATGQFGEMGLMQVRLATARSLGFQGGLTELFDLETNIRYGMENLGTAWRLARGDVCQALLKYRTSYGESEITPRISAECIRLRMTLQNLGSPLASAVAEPASPPRPLSQVEAAPLEAAPSPAAISIPPAPNKAEPGTKVRVPSGSPRDSGPVIQTGTREVAPVSVVRPISAKGRQVAAARTRLAVQRKQVRTVQVAERQQRSAKIRENEQRLQRLMAAICSGCGEKPARGRRTKLAPL